MQTYYLIPEKKIDPETREPVLIGRHKTGKGFGVASGATMDEALAQLKAMAGEIMAAMAEEGEDPLELLLFGTAPDESATFSPRELFPVLLRFRRISQGLTQVELATKLGISQPSYSKYERYDANPTMETVGELEKALGTPLMVPYHSVLVA